MGFIGARVNDKPGLGKRWSGRRGFVNRQAGRQSGRRGISDRRVVRQAGVRQQLSRVTDRELKGRGIRFTGGTGKRGGS